MLQYHSPKPSPKSSTVYSDIYLSVTHCKALHIYCMIMSGPITLDEFINPETASEEIRNILPKIRPHWKNKDTSIEVSMFTLLKITCDECNMYYCQI